MNLTILEQTTQDLKAYAEVSIAYRVETRFRITNGQLAGVIAVNPWIKDYDEYDEDRPDHLPLRWNMGEWGILAAFDGENRLGGCILAFRTPEMNLLQGRTDLVHVIDFRVREEARGTGIGRALWRAAEEWSRTHGAVEIRVETQDINFPACRFYERMGCKLLRTDANAYEGLDEVQLIWGKPLETQAS